MEFYDFFSQISQIEAQIFTEIILHWQKAFAAHQALFGPVTYISGGLEEFLENTVNQRGIDAVV